MELTTSFHQKRSKTALRRPRGPAPPAEGPDRGVVRPVTVGHAGPHTAFGAARLRKRRKGHLNACRLHPCPQHNVSNALRSRRTGDPDIVRAEPAQATRQACRRSRVPALDTVVGATLLISRSRVRIPARSPKTSIKSSTLAEKPGNLGQRFWPWGKTGVKKSGWLLPQIVTPVFPHASAMASLAMPTAAATPA